MVIGSDFNKFCKVVFTDNCGKYKKGDEQIFKDDVVLITADEYKKLSTLFEHKKILSDADIEKAKEMRSTGLSLNEIAKVFKVSKQTIFRDLKK